MDNGCQHQHIITYLHMAHTWGSPSSIFLTSQKLDNGCQPHHIITYIHIALVWGNPSFFYLKKWMMAVTYLHRTVSSQPIIHFFNLTKNGQWLSTPTHQYLLHIALTQGSPYSLCFLTSQKMDKRCQQLTLSTFWDEE